MGGGGGYYSPTNFTRNGSSYNRRKTSGCLGCLLPTVLIITTILASVICTIAFII